MDEVGDDTRPLRVSWLSYHASPYRVALWREVARQVRLEVLVLESRERFLRSSTALGEDWVSYLDDGYTTREVPSVRLGPADRAQFVALPGAWRESRPDVLLLGGWTTPAYLQALAFCRHHRIATVAFAESTLLSHRRTRGWVARLRRRFHRSVDAIVVPGPAARDAMLALGVDPARVHTGFNAIDGRAIRAAADRVRAESPAPATGHRFLYLGRLAPEKRPTDAVAAFQRIAGPVDTLSIVGAGPLRAELAELALGDPRIILRERVPYGEVPAVLARHDTLVLPSAREVWGFVVNEALAAGLHVVVSDHCGVAPSVEHMAGAYVAAPDDLAEAMARSRAEWRGPIAEPEILSRDPAEFAAVFTTAFRSAVATVAARGAVA